MAGVVHLKAAPLQWRRRKPVGDDGTAKPPLRMATPVTLSLICDNTVDSWKMTVQGVECVLYDLQTGWIDLERSLLTMRDYILQHMTFHHHADVDASGVLQHPNAWSWQDVLSKLAWEEHLQLV
jgi:hypothetical protein